MSVKGVSYDPREGEYIVQSTSSPLKEYKLTPFRSTNTWSCSCPDYIYRAQGAPGKDCKHINRVRVIDELKSKKLIDVPIYTQKI